MVFVDLGGQKLCVLFVKVIWSCPICPAGSPRADPTVVVWNLGCGVCTGLEVRASLGSAVSSSVGRVSCPPWSPWAVRTLEMREGAFRGTLVSSSYVSELVHHFFGPETVKL